MERRNGGRMYSKSYLKDIVTVRSLSQCLEEATSSKRVNSLKFCTSGLADGTTHCDLLLEDKKYKARKLWKP